MTASYAAFDSAGLNVLQLRREQELIRNEEASHREAPLQCPWGRVFRLPLVTTRERRINKGQTSLPSSVHNKGSAGR